jgi:hypothetical protein
MKRPVPFHSNAVWPPLGLVAVFVLAYGMLAGGVWLIEQRAPALTGRISSFPEIANVRAVILRFAGALYAFYRLWRFHPVCHPPYAAWLHASPWTPARPLPFGPVQPVWQDAVVVGALAAVARWHAQVSPAIPVAAFLVAYLVGMTTILALTRAWTACLLLGFLWPAPCLPVLRGAPIAFVLGAMFIVIWYGYRKGLQALPWRRDGSDTAQSLHNGRAKSLLEVDIRIDALNQGPAAQTPALGWPLQCLSPKAGSPPMAKSTSLALSVLLGWWAYCAILALEMPLDAASHVLFFSLAAAGFFRFILYCSGLRPPFNLWGRFASSRLIVPGFDQVLLIPLLVVALGIVGAVVVRQAGPWYPELTAACVALVWFVLLAGPPTLRKWVLTGQHRYRPPARAAGSKQLIRPI